MSAMEDSSLKGGCGTGKSVVLWGIGAIDDGMSGYLIEQRFPTRGARTPWGCEMVIQILVLHFCPVMLSSLCANSSAQPVFNYRKPNKRPSIQPKTMRDR